jgi:hypothetical protein
VEVSTKLMKLVKLVKLVKLMPNTQCGYYIINLDTSGQNDASNRTYSNESSPSNESIYQQYRHHNSYL